MGHRLLDLTPYRNALAATYDSERSRGSVNAWGNSFPAEELPSAGRVEVADVPFRLPERGPSHDSLEATGQLIGLPGEPRVRGIALLCFGEMGTQELDLGVVGPRGMRRITVLAPGWLVPDGLPHTEPGIRFSHLHYPGDYELTALRPVLWCRTARWAPTDSTQALQVGENPLFHILAVTLLTAGSRDD
jgi:hypothetical protein